MRFTVLMTIGCICLTGPASAKDAGFDEFSRKIRAAGRQDFEKAVASSRQEEAFSAIVAVPQFGQLLDALIEEYARVHQSIQAQTSFTPDERIYAMTTNFLKEAKGKPYYLETAIRVYSIATVIASDDRKVNGKVADRLNQTTQRLGNHAKALGVLADQYLETAGGRAMVFEKTLQKQK